MMKRKTNKKAFIFLIILVIFGVVSTKVIAQFNDGTLSLKNLGEETSTSQPQITYHENNVITMTTEDNSLYYEVLPKEQTVDITDEVKKVLGSTTTSCDDYANSFNIRRFCETSSTEGVREDVAGDSQRYEGSKSGGGVKASAKLKIQLITVTFPAQFANGSKTVKDNRKDISKTDPVYKSFGDELSSDYGDRFKAPSEVKSGESFTEGATVGKESFKIFAENQITSAQEKISNLIGEYVVEKEDNEKYCSKCNQSIQPSYFNSKPSNDVGAYLNDMMQIPGGDPDVAAGGSCIPRNDSMTEYFTDGLEDLCAEPTGINPFATFVGVVNSFFAQADWTDCTTLTLRELLNGEVEQNSDECYSVEDFLVEITSIFGDVEDCINGVCTNTYLTRRFRSTLSPAEIGNYQENGSSSEDSLRHAILTPCRISITVEDGIFRSPREVETYCVWDSSPTLGYYRLLENEKIPQQKDFPQTFEEYWELVKKAVKKDNSLSQ